MFIATKLMSVLKFPFNSKCYSKNILGLLQDKKNFDKIIKAVYKLVYVFQTC